MSTAKYQVIVMVGLVLAGGAAFLRQREVTVQLRVEVAELRRQNQVILALRTEHQRLIALQVSADELANLQAEHAELVQLREAMNVLARKNQAPVPATTAPPVSSDPTLVEDSEMIPAREWKNAGRATPAAALETILWAAAGGDIDALTQLVKLDGTARAKAEAILAGLPADLQTTYSSPERLIALLGAKDAPAGSMQVVRTTDFNADNAVLEVRLENAAGKQKKTVLGFRRDADGWKLIVPTEIVEKYGRDLTGQPSPVTAQ